MTVRRLQSGGRYYWQVRVWDGSGRVRRGASRLTGKWACLEPSDWQARWIEPDLKEDRAKSEPAPMLRRAFRVNGDDRSARAYVTSHGLYEMHLNGQRVGDQVFTPGWTSYNKRLQYQTYDVTNLLQVRRKRRRGAARQRLVPGLIGWSGQRNFYGDRLALLMQIRIVYRDGRQEIVGTDQNWKATTGPILPVGDLRR